MLHMTASDKYFEMATFVLQKARLRDTQMSTGSIVLEDTKGILRLQIPSKSLK